MYKTPAVVTLHENIFKEVRVIKSFSLATAKISFIQFLPSATKLGSGQLTVVAYNLRLEVDLEHKISRHVTNLLKFGECGVK